MEKMLKKFAILLMATIILTGCGTAYKSVNLFNLEIGMTKNEVVKAIGKNPDNLIGTKQYSDGTVEVVQYSGCA